MDEGLSTMQENFLANREKSLYKILSAKQLTIQESINQSMVAALSVSYAVLYFCTIPTNIILNGTDLEVKRINWLFLLAAGLWIWSHNNFMSRCTTYCRLYFHAHFLNLPDFSCEQDIIFLNLPRVG
jgi:hypothetical protein